MRELDTLIRRVDEDRWMASRFAPADVRAKLIAIYAANYEIARTSEVAREPGLCAIRLAWWREALEEIANGQAPRAHPALEALKWSGVPASSLSALRETTEARASDFETAPFGGWAALEAYVDATAGAVLRAGLAACGVAEAPGFAVAAGRAWGLAGLARAALHWRARGRTLWAEHDLIAHAERAHEQAREAAQQLSSAAFPAMGYLATVPGYLRALRSGRRETSPLARRVALIAASATGRI